MPSLYRNRQAGIVVHVQRPLHLLMPGPTCKVVLAGMHVLRLNERKERVSNDVRRTSHKATYGLEP